MEKSKIKFNLDIKQFIKSSCFALCTTVVGILLFAVLLKFWSLTDFTIKIINQIIKIVSVLVGVKGYTKKDKTQGLIKGALIGLTYTILSYFVFSILVASFTFSATIIYDILFLSIAGIIFGVLFVNNKKY